MKNLTAEESKDTGRARLGDSTNTPLGRYFENLSDGRTQGDRVTCQATKKNEFIESIF